MTGVRKIVPKSSRKKGNVKVRLRLVLASPECSRCAEITEQLKIPRKPPKNPRAEQTDQRAMDVTKSTSGRTDAGAFTKSP